MLSDTYFADEMSLRRGEDGNVGGRFASTTLRDPLDLPMELRFFDVFMRLRPTLDSHRHFALYLRDALEVFHILQCHDRVDQNRICTAAYEIVFGVEGKNVTKQETRHEMPNEKESPQGRRSRRQSGVGNESTRSSSARRSSSRIRTEQVESITRALIVQSHPEMDDPSDESKSYDGLSVSIRDSQSPEDVVHAATLGTTPMAGRGDDSLTELDLFSERSTRFDSFDEEDEDVDDIDDIDVPFRMNSTSSASSQPERGQSWISANGIRLLLAAGVYCLRRYGSRILPIGRILVGRF